MTEFLHEVVKKREHEMEMRGLRDFDSIFQRAMGLPFRVPTIPIPPANEIAYRSDTNNGVTQHSVVFPNVSGWIQCAVMIVTPGSVTLRSQELLTMNAWELLAGHPCRPNYTWSNNAYVCNSCSGRYETSGSEWQR